ncbi:hypothetical protein Tsubulata_023783 [Turnera subulata]|uniref:Tetratricopeptide repeat-like domain-containing protein n=1 Tax=Turnera subulata TaxID=218843 RepID=A0A9Q0F8S7_9ROSI|nr:hypothetical protein Tsubulata_023783 [Turnera subulata]
MSIAITTAVVTPGATTTTTTTTTSRSRSRRFLLRFRVQCSTDSKPPRRGFAPKNDSTSTSTSTSTNKTNKPKSSRDQKPTLSQQQRNSRTTQSGSLPPTQAPGLSSRLGGNARIGTQDTDFEERLQAVRRSALEQKKAEEIKTFGPIDYDAPVETETKTIGVGTKIGVGVAVLVFGLVFALGDFLPSGSDGPTEEAAVVSKKLSEEEKATIQTRLKQFEATLSISPKDPTALEGAAVSLAELGEYNRASALLQDLAKEKPNDPDVFRLLGEVKFELKDYEGSAAAYKSSAMVSKNVKFEVLRGLTNALLAAKKPDEAVQFLLASRAHLNSEKSGDSDIKTNNNGRETGAEEIDPIQVDLLLGKAYSDWGHVSDAISVYDQLISVHPDDFRGYLAKGIILKENGSLGDAERMFIQAAGVGYGQGSSWNGTTQWARFFAPEKVKALVDRYSRK